MSDTFDRVSETRVERGLLQRADLLREMQRLMPTYQLEDTRLFPQWLHVLRQTDALEARDTWTGRVRAPRLATPAALT